MGRRVSNEIGAKSAGSIEALRQRDRCASSRTRTSRRTCGLLFEGGRECSWLGVAIARRLCSRFRLPITNAT